MARSDVEVLLRLYEPDVEVWIRTMFGVGSSDCYRGHEGIRALYADLDEAFDAWSWAPTALVDGGDCIWQEWFVEEDAWERALDAVGLRE